MDKHTPGPWTAERDDSNERYDIGVPADVGIRLVAEVSFGYDEPAESEQHANAALIAAAPDMLAALRTCLAYIGSTDRYKSAGEGAHAINAARDAINKAVLPDSHEGGK